MTWLRLVIYGLACFRLAVLLSDDSGPYRVITKLRSFLKREEKHNKALRKSDVAHGVECLRCNSLWFAAPVAAFAFVRPCLPLWASIPCDAFLFWLALSAIVILLHRAFPQR